MSQSYAATTRCASAIRGQPNFRAARGITGTRSGVLNVGDIQMVAVLLQSGAAVDAKTATRWTPLHMAAAAGHSSVVLRLLEGGAAANRGTNGGLTPLKLAVRLHHDECAEILRMNGAHE